jgi:hypothetical protein
MASGDGLVNQKFAANAEAPKCRSFDSSATADFAQDDRSFMPPTLEAGQRARMDSEENSIELIHL